MSTSQALSGSRDKTVFPKLIILISLIEITNYFALKKLVNIESFFFVLIVVENISKSQDAHGGNTNVHGIEATKGMYQGLMTNFSLLMLSKVIRDMWNHD